MYFKQPDEIIARTKTQTRRVCKPGEYLLTEGYDTSTVVTTTVYSYKGIDPMGQSSLFNGHTDRLKWQVGRDYAVQPGRGKPGVWWQSKHVWGMPTQSFEGFDRSIYSPDSEIGIARGWQPLRIVITAIRREPLQDISEAGAIAEGWPEDEDVRECPHCDALYPTGWYDGPNLPCTCTPTTWYRMLWESINGAGSWDANPDVWVLEFEVI